MDRKIFISYRWTLIGDILTNEEELIENYEVKAIGSDYTEAKEIATHISKRKGLRLLQIRTAVVSGINLAYYEDDNSDVPTHLFGSLPEPVIPNRL